MNNTMGFYFFKFILTIILVSIKVEHEKQNRN